MPGERRWGQETCVLCTRRCNSHVYSKRKTLWELHPSSGNQILLPLGKVISHYIYSTRGTTAKNFLSNLRRRQLRTISSSITLRSMLRQSIVATIRYHRIEFYNTLWSTPSFHLSPNSASSPRWCTHPYPFCQSALIPLSELTPFSRNFLCYTCTVGITALSELRKMPSSVTSPNNPGYCPSLVILNSI